MPSHVGPLWERVRPRVRTSTDMEYSTGLQPPIFESPCEGARAHRDYSTTKSNLRYKSPKGIGFEYKWQEEIFRMEFSRSS